MSTTTTPPSPNRHTDTIPDMNSLAHSMIKADEILQPDRTGIWRILQHLRILTPQDYVFSIDLTALWRRHVVWSHKDGKELLEIVTARFATTQIFLSLLFAAEVGTYFSPSRIVTDVRDALRTGPYVGDPVMYACGFMLIVSIAITGSAVLANYIALGMFKCVSSENASIVLRSSIGLYTAQLPSRLTFASLLTFFAWNIMFWWINNESYTTPSIILTTFTIIILVHVIASFSALGKIIMATGAMTNTPILPKGTEEKLLPHQLTNVLISETHIAHQLNTPVNLKYFEGNERSKRQLTADYVELLRRRHPFIQVEHVAQGVMSFSADWDVENPPPPQDAEEGTL